MGSASHDGALAAHRPPTPDKVTSLDDLAAALRELRSWAGSPTYASIVRDVRDARIVRGVSPTEATPGRVTVYDCFRSGRRRIDVDLVTDIAAVLGADNGVVWRHAAHAAMSGNDLTAFVPIVTSLPPRPTAFTGRGAVLRDLTDARSPLVQVISGMPGMGKTALAARAAHDLRDRRQIDEVVYLNLAGLSERGDAADPFDAMTAVLQVRATVGAGDMDPSTRHDAYLKILGSRRTLLVLDDVVSWNQVQPLLSRDRTTRTIVTSRWVLDAPPGPMLHTLRGFDDSAIAALLSRTTGRTHAEHDAAVHQLGEITGRLPLALRLVAQRLTERPDWSLADHVETYRELLAAAHLDDDVQGALGVTYAQLTGPARCALRRIALHPTPRSVTTRRWR